jgi:hypothetical protein
MRSADVATLLADADRARPMRPSDPQAAADGNPFVTLTARQFVRSMRPPEDIVDGLLRRGYLYAVSGPTGSGKTSVGVALAGCFALEHSFAGHEVAGGTVLYVASENPDDVAGRVAAWCQVSGTDVDELGTRLQFIDESFVLADRRADLIRAIESVGAVMVIIDTDQAVAGSDDENDNSERIQHAKRLRTLTKASTRPTVIDLCHPAGGATRTALRPRGGTSFLAEVDGQFGCWSDDDGVSCELFRTPKFRGPDFDPITFHLRRTSVSALVDTQGRPLSSVVAMPATAEDEARMDHDRRASNLAVLRSVSQHPEVSIRERVVGTGCSKSTVARALRELREQGFIRDDAGSLQVLPKGARWLAVRA